MNRHFVMPALAALAAAFLLAAPVDAANIPPPSVGSFDPSLPKALERMEAAAPAFDAAREFTRSH